MVHRGDRAVYVGLAGWCVGVLTRDAAAVPCGLRTRLDLLPPVTSARIAAGVLHLDEHPVVVGRVHPVAVPDRRDLRDPGRVATPPDAAALVGSGDGLTPQGDDVLCGWLAACRGLGVATPEVDAAVRGLLHRTTLLSATLLDCALQGEVLDEFAAWLRALGTADATAATARLLAVGHTSGAGLLTGARRALLSLGAGAGVAGLEEAA